MDVNAHAHEFDNACPGSYPKQDRNLEEVVILFFKLVKVVIQTLLETLRAINIMKASMAATMELQPPPTPTPNFHVTNLLIINNTSSISI